MSEKKETSLLTLSSAPHVKDEHSVSKIMWMVVIALLPVAAYSVFLFGLNSFLIMATAVVTALFSEAIFQVIMKRDI